MDAENIGLIGADPVALPAEGQGIGGLSQWQGRARNRLSWRIR